MMMITRVGLSKLPKHKILQSSRRGLSLWSKPAERGFLSRSFNQDPEHLLWGIVGANAIVTAAWFISGQNRSLQRFLIKHFTLSGANVFLNHAYHTLLTCAFSHKDIMHFLFNMFTFYTFGNSIVHIIGAGRFAVLYLGGGLVSSVCQVMWPLIVPRTWPAWNHVTPHDISLGASGAVNAVVAFSILTNPGGLILLYGVVPLPAALFGLGFIGMDAYSLYKGDSKIGNAAHLGGAVFGAMMFAMTRGRMRRF